MSVVVSSKLSVSVFAVYCKVDLYVELTHLQISTHLPFLSVNIPNIRTPSFSQFP